MKTSTHLLDGHPMKICSWVVIQGFQSPNEFIRFGEWMHEQISGGRAERCSVLSSYLGGNTFHEQWFCHIKCGQVWRPISPDTPFLVLFKAVTVPDTYRIDYSIP
jgi:hypothetical protein